MEPLRLILAHSCAYWSVAALVSVIFGIQGAFIQRNVIEQEIHTRSRHWARWEPWLIHYPE